MTETAKTEPAGGVHVEKNFLLQGGGVLPEAAVAYITMGRLNAQRDNAVLITHGYTSTHRFIEPGSAAAEGSWSELVGPGRAIDTDSFFVVSSNALGSCYGSTGPGSTNPATGAPWGPDFPKVDFADIVRLQKLMLDALGVKHLHAVAGVSMGGFQTLQWGVQYPDLMDRLVVALSALDGAFVRPQGTNSLGEALAAQPGWNGGRPAPGAMQSFLTGLRVNTLQNYGMDAYLAAQGLDADARAASMREMAAQWARGFDAASLVVLRDAISAFNVRPHLSAIRAKLLLVLSTTDALFPASAGPAVTDELREAGVDASFHHLESPYGHLASGLDWQGWSGALRDFLA